MPKVAKAKKTLTDKEKKLLAIIAEAQEKLATLQEKQKIEIGELACSHGLHEFDLKILNEEFKKLAIALKHKKED